MALEKLLDLIGDSEQDISSKVDDEKLVRIVQDAKSNYEIDLGTIQYWIEDNKKAVNLIRQYADEDIRDEDGIHRQKNYPFEKASKYIYPLIAQASIHLSAKLDSHIKRNNRNVHCAVHGDDPDDQIEQRGLRVAEHLSYQTLEQDKSWLLEQHKINMIACTWGTAFKKVYRDHIRNKNQSDLLAPEDVIINNFVSSLDKCERVTIRNYMSCNDIYEQINVGHFRQDIEIDQLKRYVSMEKEISPDDTNPIITVYEQYCLLDLDEDGYREPYTIWFHDESQTLLGIIPAFEAKDIQMKGQGQILSIAKKHYIVDFHCIDDPNGRFYSIGLNYLLYNNNKALNSLVRQLIDSGTLANQQGGFVTRGFIKDKQKLEFELGEFKRVDLPPHLDLKKQIMPLPFKEPSQVLLALVQFLSQESKALGFVTDVLTGNTELQNVPATTMLAAMEKGTLAMKPIIEKLYASLSKEFNILFDLNREHLSNKEYQEFHNNPKLFVKTNQQFEQVGDYERGNFDITPVVDPNFASESYRYARLRALLEASQQLPGILNLQKIAKDVLSGLNIDDKVDQYIMPPQQPPPDPKMIEVQMKQQKMQQDAQMDQVKQELEKAKLANEELKTKIKLMEVQIKKDESGEKQQKMKADSYKDMQEGQIKQRMAKVSEFDALTKRQQVQVSKEQVEVAKQQLNKRTKE